MIKLKWAQIRDPEFNPVLQKLMKANMPFQTAKRLLDVMKLIQAEQTKSDEMWTSLNEKFLEPIEAQPGMLQIKATFSDEEKTEAQKTIQEFFDTTFEIEKAQLTAEELKKVELSAQELLKLDGLIEG